MIYKEVILHVTESIREQLIGDLLMLNFESFTDNNEYMHAYIPANRWNDSIYQELTNRLLSYQEQDLIDTFKINVQDIYPQNWQEQWEKTITPVYVGNSIVIHPSWQTIDTTQNKTDIIIDPKMSFGTGHHETTQLMVSLIEEYISIGSKVLDVGTGSGILAIVAAKLGASEVYAIDTDPDSINDADENCKLNKVSDTVQLFEGELATISEIEKKKFDLIVANIERKTILKLFDLFIDHLLSGGLLLLSGLLDTDLPYIKEACINKNVSTLNTIKRTSKTSDTWIAIALQK